MHGWGEVLTFYLTGKPQTEHAIIPNNLINLGITGLVYIPWPYFLFYLFLFYFFSVEYHVDKN